MREIEGLVGLTGCAKALRIVVVSALTLLVVLPAAASAASTAQIRTVTLLDPFFETFVDVPQVFVTGDAGNNNITVTVSGDFYTVSDTTGITAGAGCTQVGTGVTCPATGVLEAVVEAGGGDDTVMGSAGADSIFGEGGADNIHGGPAGSDFIRGGDGDDVLNSGGGGIPGVDDQSCFSLPVDPTSTVRTSWCGDDVNGGSGFDTLTYADRLGPVKVNLTEVQPNGRSAFDDDGTTDGLNDVESVIGGWDSDEIIGGLFGETLSGGPGNAPDVICGGLGNDTVTYADKTSPVNVTLDGSLETDPGITSSNVALRESARRDCRPTIKDINAGGGSGLRNGQVCTETNTHPSCPPGLPRDCVNNDGVEGEHDCVGEDVENVVGSPLDDILVGNSPDPGCCAPHLEPSGANVLTGGGGDDLLDGLLGPDVFIGGDGNDTVSYEGRTDDVDASLDGAANDGSALDFNPDNEATDEITDTIENLIGGSGNDLLKGNENDNVLLGRPGNDLIQGHGGNDQLGGDGGNDSLEGGGGFDTLEGGANDDTLKGGAGRDSYDGGDGSDIVDFSSATTPVSVTLDGAANDGEAFEGDLVHGNVEGAIGGLDDDVLHGNDGPGTFIGNGGNDTFYGGLGADTFIGGAGVDTVSYSDHGGPVNVNLAVPGGDGAPGENDNVTSDVEAIGGSPFNDVLIGDGKLNTINGGDGDDRISGAEGDDYLGGGRGKDTLNGDAGNDTLDGAEGDDTLNGGAGNDTLRGFTGVDVLDGGSGADTMSGGDGVDVVSYASRSGDVSVDTLGDPDDGEKGENDQVRTDVESVRTGSGDDSINIADGATGEATCGAGSDDVRADPSDEVGSGCEANQVRQAGICVPSRSVRMSQSGVVSLRLSCAFNAKGTIQLRSAGRVKTGKGKARRLSLGKKSFAGKLGHLTVRVKLSKRLRSVVKRKKRLRVRATLIARRDAVNSKKRTNRTTLTLRTSKK